MSSAVRGGRFRLAMARAAVSEIISFLGELAEEEDMRVTVQQTARGGCIAGGGAVVGGLTAGPVGLAVGGIIGSILGAATSKSFKPVAQIIKEMPDHKKERLAGRVRNILTNRDIQTLAALAVTTGAAGAVRHEIVQELQRYITAEMQMALA
ncbi:hypothetical protein JTE90_023117 [Oedothorax gibbosus]|uniref:Uncharacterized protein n=1 Tax=Oedothorax gibbosus TaxID=931172 RepID=A0AAV6UQ07_9ARAC|nr:hypothetical protein JTE90_023117 [Oedothorax gibbosus]